jgi:hypothetical protein
MNQFSLADQEVAHSCIAALSLLGYLIAGGRVYESIASYDPTSDGRPDRVQVVNFLHPDR